MIFNLIVPNLLELVSKPKVATGDDDDIVVLLGPAVDRCRGSRNHPLRIMQQDDPFVPQRIQFLSTQGSIIGFSSCGL